MSVPFLKVLQPGILTTVQDTGRFGYQRLGYTQSGAMDDFALRIGNRLVGNPENEAGLELTFFGEEFLFLCDAVIAVTGADFCPEINGSTIPMWQSILVKKDSVISFRNRKYGARAYICVRGGVDVPRILNSKSTDLKSAFGGYMGRKLQAGDILSIPRIDLPADYIDKRFPEELVYTNYRWHDQPLTIRVTLGPDKDNFTEKGYKTLLESEYEISEKLDRQGYQLVGPRIEHSTKGPNIITNFTSLGAVQVPGAGTPIILMKDRQTSGGYAKIANIISPDISKLAQRGMGDKISFESVDISQTRDLFIDQEKTISKTELDLIRRCVSFKVQVDDESYIVKIEEVDCQ